MASNIIWLPVMVVGIGIGVCAGVRHALEQEKPLKDDPPVIHLGDGAQVSNPMYEPDNSDYPGPQYNGSHKNPSPDPNPVAQNQPSDQHQLQRRLFFDTEGKDLKAALTDLKVREEEWAERIRKLATAIRLEGRDPSADQTYAAWQDTIRQLRDDQRALVEKSKDAFLAYFTAKLNPDKEVENAYQQSLRKGLGEAKRLHLHYQRKRLPRMPDREESTGSTSANSPDTDSGNTIATRKARGGRKIRQGTPGWEPTMNVRNPYFDPTTAYISCWQKGFAYLGPDDPRSMHDRKRYWITQSELPLLEAKYGPRSKYARR